MTKKTKQAPKSSEVLQEVLVEAQESLRNNVKTVLRRIQKDVHERQTWIKNRTKQIDLLLKIQEDMLTKYESGDLTNEEIDGLFKRAVERVGMMATGNSATKRPTPSRFSYDEDED